MSNLVITNVDVGSVVLKEGQFRDDEITVAGAVTLADGTILGRITATGKLAPYASGAADGSEIPKAVLSGEHAFSGAGDFPVRPLVAGSVRRERLIENGKAAGVDITSVVCDQLRDYSIIPIDVKELNIPDNQ